MERHSLWYGPSGVKLRKTITTETEVRTKNRTLYGLRKEQIIMYSEDEIHKVLEKYDETGSVAATIIALGYPSRCNLHRWIKNRDLLSKVKSRARGTNTSEHPRHPPVALKLEILHRCFELGEDIKLVSEETGYSRASIYS